MLTPQQFNYDSQPFAINKRLGLGRRTSIQGKESTRVTGKFNGRLRRSGWLFYIQSAVISVAGLHMFNSPVLASEPIEEPHAQYQVLEWEDLVAEGWERPLLLSKKDVASPSVDESSLVPELNNKLVALPGFMRPVVSEGELMAEHKHEHKDLSLIHI